MFFLPLFHFLSLFLTSFVRTFIKDEEFSLGGRESKRRRDREDEMKAWNKKKCFSTRSCDSLHFQSDLSSYILILTLSISFHAFSAGHKKCGRILKLKIEDLWDCVLFERGRKREIERGWWKEWVDEAIRKLIEELGQKVMTTRENPKGIKCEGFQV